MSGALDGWIVTLPISEVVHRMEAMRRHRAGESGLHSASLAVQALRTFALERPIAELLELESDGRDADHFHPVDATAILALAALTRPIEQAAELAIQHCEKELASGSGSTALTDAIVHDITAQRTVADMAVFIRRCRRVGQDVLVGKTLEAFAGARSGRTSLDKALLYLTLDTELGGERCAPDAAALLELALRNGDAEHGPGTDPGDRIGRPHGIVGALGHLCPTGMIVERWVDARLAEAEQADPAAGAHQRDATIGLVSHLLVSEPEGARELARHVGRGWPAPALRDLCERLVKLSAARFAEVRGHAAAREYNAELIAIIRTWWDSEQLSGRLGELFEDLVAAGTGGSGGPRPIPALDRLHSDMEYERSPRECRTMLRVAVAQHVEGRTGAEVAEQLGRIEDGGGLKSAARVVNRRLTARLVDEQIDAELLVGYFKGLQLIPKRPAALSFWALQALSDPTVSDGVLKGAVIGGLATRLYAERLEQIAFDLLERYLENEQEVTARDAADLVGKVYGSAAMAADPRWNSLLAATIGRWADARGRDEILKELYGRGLEEACETVIHSVQ